MLSCHRCGRTLPDDEPSCPECGTQPAAPDVARRPLRALDGRGADAVTTLTPSRGLPSAGRVAQPTRGLHAVASASAAARVAAGPVMLASSVAAAAGELEPKTQVFADERTGSQRKTSGEWAKGGGEGAKILALRPEDAPPETAEAAATPLDARLLDARSLDARPVDARPVDARPVDARLLDARPVDARLLDARPSESPPERLTPEAAQSGIRTSPAPAQIRTTSGEHRKPLVLASECMRADIAPNDPGRGIIRVAAVAVGGAGAAAVLTVAGFAPISLSVAAAMLVIAAFGLVPLDYRRRAYALVAVALPAVVATSFLAAPRGGVPHGGLLAMMVSGLAGALYFRAEYRASRLARGLVGLGVAAGATWLALSGALGQLTTLDAAWQSWLPVLVATSLALVLALALLGFMTHNSTGACSAWATTLLVWFAVYASATHAAELFPAAGPALAGEWRLGVAMGAVATPLLAAVTAIAVAQILVVMSGGGREDREPATEHTTKS